MADQLTLRLGMKIHDLSHTEVLMVMQHLRDLDVRLGDKLMEVIAETDPPLRVEEAESLMGAISPFLKYIGWLPLGQPTIMTILCECSERCTETIEIPLEEFLRIRSSGKVAVLSKRCRVLVIEPIIEEHGDFIVVRDTL